MVTRTNVTRDYAAIPSFLVTRKERCHVHHAQIRTASVYRRRDLCLFNPPAPPSLGRYGPRGARPVPWRRSDPRWLAQRDHGGHARRPTRPRLAVAGADGGRSCRLVKLGPPRQLG